MKAEDKNIYYFLDQIMFLDYEIGIGRMNDK